jgi:hypothetical protein
MRTAVLLSALLASCSKGGTAAPPAASSSPAASQSAAPAETRPLDPTEPAVSTAAPSAANLPLPPREAARRAVKRLQDDRALAPQAAVVTAHFGELPSPLEVQSVALPGDRQALLAYSGKPPAKPLLWVANAEGEILWSKERPLAGTRQIVTEMVLAPGPNGEVTLLWCDIPTQIVGLRKWAADSVVLADFQVLEVDLCESLAGLYWPGRGWIAVASQHGAARAQLLEERGARAWGAKGVELPWTARPSSPVAVVIDSETSAILLQVGDRPKAGSIVPDRVLAMRYDPAGGQVWDAPIDLGPAASTASGARIEASVVSPGKVQVTVGGHPIQRVVLTSAGNIVAR